MRRIVILLAVCLFPISVHAEALQMGTKVTTQSDVTVTSALTPVASQNSARSSLSCTNTHASVHVRWGDSNITASRGQQLKAGLSVEIRNTDDVYMISEGANVTVSCTIETR